MNKEYENKYNRLSEHHCWFVARRELILGLMKRYNITRDQKILEIGCGWGELINKLNADGFSNTCGFDISDEAVAHCQSRGLKNITKMDVANMNYEDNSFDLIIASDVLEHVENEEQALKEVHRILKRDGLFIIMVPALNLLWGEHDIVNAHFRRYTKTYLNKGLQKNNFSVITSSYWNSIVFFPVLFIRLLKRIISFVIPSTPKDAFYSLPPVLNKLMLWVLKAENTTILRAFNLPIGISVFSVVKK